MTFEVEYDTLDVTRCSGEVSCLVVAASLVVEGENDEGTIDGASTTGSILQQFLCFGQVDKCLF